jgi:quercetin dioxygenase-like cupin family protein
MRLKGVLAVLVALFVFVGGAQVQYSGAGITPAAQAQDQAEKGVKTKNLVTSLGGYRQVDNIPIVLTGMTVEIAPGGQTGRERYLVPTYIYVLDGTLTTDTQGGPVGVAGVQYHAEGQSYSSPVAIWHNHMNNGTTPVKYLLLFIGAPSGPTMEKAKAE